MEAGNKSAAAGVDFALRGNITHRHHAGEFWKPCPGTTAGYLCCGYQILTPLTGCGMYCRYCILQVYLEDPGQVVFENFADLENEVRRKLPLWKGVVRFGTGEFADSLFLEPRIGASLAVARLLEPYENVFVEFKTKSVNVRMLEPIQKKYKVAVGFSVNTPEMIATYESGTASLDQRIAAAQWCVAQGFRLAFHFDPMFYYDGCEEHYAAVVERILTQIPQHESIVWWSMGGFRSMPDLKKALQKSANHLPLFSGELTLGEDRKYRYVRPLRERLYSAVVERAERLGAVVPWYLCMESPEVWQACGLDCRIPQGLSHYLDTRAACMLGLEWHEGLKGGWHE